MDYKDEDTKIFELIEQAEEEKVESKEINDKKKDKFSLKDKWNKFTKKQKILIIILSSLIVLFGFLAIILLTKEDKQAETKKPDEPKIVITNKNYRYEDGNLIFLNKDSQEIGKYNCKNKDVQKCYIAYNSDEDELDETKYIYEDGSAVKTQTPIVNDSYVFVYDNDSENESVVVLYNIKNKKIEETYKTVKKAINNDCYFIVVNTLGEYGLIKIDENGIAQTIKFNYQYLAVADKSVQEISTFIAQKNDKYFIVDINEKQLSKPIKNAIIGYNDNYLKAISEDRRTSIYDYQGNKKFENTYEYIYLSDKYFGVVKDDLLFILDENENYLNVEGITLANKNYNKTYIYDNEDKLKEIVEATQIEINDNNILITTFDDEEVTYTINILESLVNNKLQYISYIDGKLYFYNDEAKKNIIGTYPCKNKNNIVDENSTLQNCYIAKESSFSDNDMNKPVENLGYLPIINNRYVFINDGLDTTKQNIILYDLVDKKTKSTYLSVDAGIYSNNSSASFYETDNLNVIAVSAKKNKYGMITIKKDDVLAFKEFTHNKIERIGNYYLLNKATNTYSLIDNINNEITKEYSYKIVSHYKNYVKVSDNGKYLLYDFSGNKITNESYDRIDLYENNFATIKNNKLSVIKYDKTVLITGIDLKINDYNNAYAINSDSVTIYNADKTFEKIPFEKNTENNLLDSEQGGDLNGEE